MNLKQITAGAIAMPLAMALATSAMAGADAFNRAHLGSSWVVTSGSLAISNHELVGGTESIGYLNSASTNTAASAVVLLGGTDLEYGAVAVGNIAGGTNAFVKIQQQNGGGTFDHGAFYTGNNGGGDFFTLSSPVPSPAILDVFFCGDVATMRITSAAGVQLYSYNYGTTFGAGAGLGTYGAVRLDNLIGFATGCADVPAGARPASEMPPAKDWSRAD
jgi:hypothetical protein